MKEISYAYGTNHFDRDPDLAAILGTYWKGFPDHRDELHRFGAFAGEDVYETVYHVDHDAAPVLVTHDLDGQRVDRARLSPAERVVLKAAAHINRPPYEGGSWHHHFALGYLMGDPGLYCVLTITNQTVYGIHKYAPSFAAWKEAMLRGDAFGATWMTEIQGGSDLGANITVARKDGDVWRLTGEKYFASGAGFGGRLVGCGVWWVLGIGGIGAATASLGQRTRRLVQTNDQLQGEVEMRRETEAELRRKHDEQRALIARLEQTRQQLLQAEKMAAIGQLAAGVAHEINNPTGYVLSNLSTLQKYLKDLLTLLDAYEQCERTIGEEEAGRLQQIRALKKSLDIDYIKHDVIDLLRESSEGMNRVRKIVKDLKDFSHADSGEWEWSDLRANIESTLNVVWNELKYRTEVVKEFGEVPQIYCIASQINQVIMNLLTNAVQAIPQRGTITIRTAREGDDVWFSVSDTGAGIAPENLQRIFDPFFTTKPVGQGTGLGLSLSFGIVQRHGGRIEVESGSGKGTTFRVWLPIRGGGEAPPPPGTHQPLAVEEIRERQLAGVERLAQGLERGGAPGTAPPAARSGAR